MCKNPYGSARGARCNRASSPKPLDGGAHDRDSRFGLTKHEPSIRSDHVITEPAKLVAPTCVSAPRAFVDRAVDFHDQTQSRSKKISDPAPAGSAVTNLPIFGS